MATNIASALQGQDLMTGLQARDVRLGTVSGSRRVHWVLFCVTTLSLFCLTDAAQAQPPVRQGRWMRGEGPRWQRFGRRQGERRFGMSRFERTIESGHLFLDGEYMTSPFEVTFENEELRVNDVVVPVPTEDYVAMEDEEEDLLLDEGDRPARRRRRPQVPRDVMHLVQTLQSDGVIVVLLGKTPVSVDPDAMFQTLISEDRTAYLDELLQYLPPTADRPAMVEWIQGYDPPAGLVEFASNWVEARDRAEAVNMASINAVRRLNQFAYPLSIFGMIIGAMSAGHLLSWRPTVAGSGQETDASPLALRMLNRSIILIVLLSLFDLTWTILASQAGQMKELNPLASRFVNDPVDLIVFKSVATCVGVGLLVGLRHHRRAQIATWWLCLVCTLLVFRWLTFSSMYVA